MFDRHIIVTKRTGWDDKSEYFVEEYSDWNEARKQ